MTQSRITARESQQNPEDCGAGKYSATVQAGERGVGGVPGWDGGKLVASWSRLRACLRLLRLQRERDDAGPGVGALGRVRVPAGVRRINWRIVSSVTTLNKSVTPRSGCSYHRHSLENTSFEGDLTGTGARDARAPAMQVTQARMKKY